MAKTTKIKLAQAPSLQQELSQLLTENISFSTKWDIRNILNSFKTEVENFNNTRIEVFKKFGELLDEKTQRYAIKDQYKKEAEKELKALAEKEIKITGKLPLKELASIKSEHPYFLVFELVEK